MKETDPEKLILLADTPHIPYVAHVTQTDASVEVGDDEVAVLRELAKVHAEIAADPVNETRREMWRKLNDLEPVRPLIWTTELCWNEMNANDELTLQTHNSVAMRIEMELRKTIYNWSHLQGDIIVEPVFYSPYVITNSGFGITVESDTREVEVRAASGEDVLHHDSGGTGTVVPGMFAASHFQNQISTEDDIQKIQDPEIKVDRERTDEFYHLYSRIFQGILPVRKRGCHGFWYAPWDDVATWMEPEIMLESLAARPEFMHKVIRRTTDAYLSALDQFENLGILARNDNNVRIGSGAYGYTKELPRSDYSERNIRTLDLWGSSVSQIFGSVSPQMQSDFGLTYEREWMDRFALIYYGCCEALHDKIDILSTLPNLRKISLSPFVDVQKAAERIDGRYVVSLKPSPIPFAHSAYSVEREMETLRQNLEYCRGCNVEIALKDLISVQLEPQRVWQWIDAAERVVREFE